MVINHHALLLFIRISQLQYAKDGRKDLGGSIAEKLDTHKCRRIEDYRIKDDILWVFDGEKWIPRKLSPTESQQWNRIKQLENQLNPCLLDVYIYSLPAYAVLFSVPSLPLQYFRLYQEPYIVLE